MGYPKLLQEEVCDTNDDMVFLEKERFEKIVEMAKDGYDFIKTIHDAKVGNRDGNMPFTTEEYFEKYGDKDWLDSDEFKTLCSAWSGWVQESDKKKYFPALANAIRANYKPPGDS